MLAARAVFKMMGLVGLTVAFDGVNDLSGQYVVELTYSTFAGPDGCGSMAHPAKRFPCARAPVAS
ncbi:MAG TPA: hypothetical protein VHV82_05005 [Sporichthyaceae bacterium]|nr:hypothetical protein [Sporichthyaceae bacterium]